nr:hypothetical protein [Planktothrix sp. FACHB-1355]
MVDTNIISDLDLAPIASPAWGSNPRLIAKVLLRGLKSFFSRLQTTFAMSLRIDSEAGECVVQDLNQNYLGKTPPFVDGQIAAIAKVNNLILVTNNVSDYADFLELQVENWFI